MSSPGAAPHEARTTNSARSPSRNVFVLTAVGVWLEDGFVATAEQQRARRAAQGARTGVRGRPRSAPHGTRGGYERHFRDGAPPCGLCRYAMASYRARLRSGREVTIDERRRQLLAVEVLRRLEVDPASVLETGRQNLARMVAADRYGHADRLLGRWVDLIDAGADPVARALVDWSEDADELRSAMPFAGVVSEAARQRALAAARS